MLANLPPPTANPDGFKWTAVAVADRNAEATGVENTFPSPRVNSK